MVSRRDVLVSTGVALTIGAPTTYWWTSPDIEDTAPLPEEPKEPEETLAPASLSLMITDGPRYHNEKLIVGYQIENEGEQIGEDVVELMRDDTVLEKKEIQIRGGDSGLGRFIYPIDTSGEIWLRMGDLETERTQISLELEVIGGETHIQEWQGMEYTVHSFTEDETITVENVPPGKSVDVVLIGGGGGGGGGNGGSAGGGGGGAGGVVLSNLTPEVGSYDLKIGQGGRGGRDGRDENGKSGTETTFGELTAAGGGGGGSRYKSGGRGGDGGSGGGGPAHGEGGKGGSGIPTQGTRGGQGGYSGGSGDNPASGGGGYLQPGRRGNQDTGPGGDGGDGWDGSRFIGTQRGENGWFAAGGGGGDGGGGGVGQGGRGGAGRGRGESAQQNTGSGGGGIRNDGTGNAGDGADGIAFIRYPGVIKTTRFEEPLGDSWETRRGGVRSNHSYSKDQSYFSGADGTDIQAVWTPYPEGHLPSKFSYYFRETSNSTGGGVRLVNSRGEYEGGTATDNPEWDIDFADKSGQIHSAGGYKEWIRVTWKFDWETGEVDIRFNDTINGRTKQRTCTLKSGLDVSRVELWNYNGGEWGDNALEMWWDDLMFE